MYRQRANTNESFDFDSGFVNNGYAQSNGHGHYRRTSGPGPQGPFNSPCPVNPTDEPCYVMYKRRWIGIGTICALNISTSIVWLTFAAVTDVSTKWLHRDEAIVNLTAILYFIAYVVTSTFSGYAFEKWGIKRALIFGATLNVVGTWLRFGAGFLDTGFDSQNGTATSHLEKEFKNSTLLPFIINDTEHVESIQNKSTRMISDSHLETDYTSRLVTVLVGHFIAALGQPFFLNAPAKYAAVWFSEGSRATATMIGSVSSPLGAAVAMFVIPLICEKPEDMPITLLIVAIIAIVAFIPTLITPNEPPTPPSASAAKALSEAADEPFWISIKKTGKILQFWLLFFLFSVFVAFFNVFSSLINQIVIPYGYTNDDAGVFGGILILAGIIGAGVCGPLIDKTKRHKLVLKLLTPLLALSYIAFIFAVRKDDYIGICIVCAVLGVWSFSLLPVALELGIECTYPIPPSSSISLLWVGGQLLSVPFLFIADTLRNDSKEADPPKNLQNALIAMASLATLTAGLVFFYTSPNYRMEAEEREKVQKQSGFSH